MKQANASVTSCLKLLTALLTVAAITILAFTPDASAQERRTLFETIFGKREVRQNDQYRPQYRERRRVTRRTKPSAAKRRPSPERSMRIRTPAVADTPIARPGTAQPAVEKAPDAKAVLVVGDFIGGGLAEGLVEAFAETPDIRITSRINGSSGFVRTDHYDWDANIKAVLDEEKPAAVVVMIGANDRQSMTANGVSYAPRTPQWTAEYAKRVDSFISTIKSAGYPLVWVGQPPFKPRGMSHDILALNEIYRTATEKAGGSFIDVWDGFVDEAGNFTLTGFDINGRTARLRANDGINVTGAGKRKLAFYAEKPLRQLLGSAIPAVVSGVASQPRMPQGPQLPARIDRVAPVSLRELDLQGSNELMGANLGQSPAPAKPASSETGKPQPGRADDFAWPRKPEPGPTPGSPD